MLEEILVGPIAILLLPEADAPFPTAGNAEPMAILAIPADDGDANAPFADPMDIVPLPEEITDEVDVPPPIAILPNAAAFVLVPTAMPLPAVLPTKLKAPTATPLVCNDDAACPIAMASTA